MNIISSLNNRGLWAWLLTIILFSFYVILYWGYDIDKIRIRRLLSPHIAASNLPIQVQNIQFKIATQAIMKYYQTTYPSQMMDRFKPVVYAARNKMIFLSRTFDPAISALHPISYSLRRKKADKWFLYGFLYTFFICFMGIRFVKRWKNDKYQKVRTYSVIFFQLVVAFIIPGLLEASNYPAFYFHYFWPLKIEAFYPNTLTKLPFALALWSAIIALIGVPILTYFFGKRWYCSWVCGCGALANTAGDPFRHLSNKSKLSWRIEHISIYSVLLIAIVTTIIVGYNQIRGIQDEFSVMAFRVQKWYAFFISAGFAGVIGTGFYPIAGTRVWCRFGCPQAAILGILQKFFSKFRITVNGDQCMSCGNCTTYCEMGIDVRQYAMQGKDIVRASCVGCGICMSVCPRGVLKLEAK